MTAGVFAIALVFIFGNRGVLLIDISFVDCNDGPPLRNGELHLGIVVFRIHAGFMRADSINAIHAKALRNLIAEILVQVQLDFQFSPRTLRSKVHRKPVHSPR